jgi:hypothetical protein
VRLIATYERQHWVPCAAAIRIRTKHSGIAHHISMHVCGTVWPGGVDAGREHVLRGVACTEKLIILLQSLADA